MSSSKFSRPKSVVDRRAVLKTGFLSSSLLALGVSNGAMADTTCRLPDEDDRSASPTASTTEGPYYFDPKLVRADITEGLAGVPLDILFTVRDLGGKPLPTARVDVWHCDAQGLYSGYAQQGDDRSLNMQGKTFLRGTLYTDDNGQVRFYSIYPGWYHGRTTHIHFKVITGERTNLTSQFFLPDSLSEFLYTNLSDYKRAQLRDTLNSIDGIALAAGETVAGTVREFGDRYVAALVLHVDPEANPEIDRPPVPGGMRPGGRGNGEGPPPDRPDFNGPNRLGGPGGRSRRLEGDARLKALIPQK